MGSNPGSFDKVHVGPERYFLYHIDLLRLKAAGHKYNRHFRIIAVCGLPRLMVFNGLSSETC